MRIESKRLDDHFYSEKDFDEMYDAAMEKAKTDEEYKFLDDLGVAFDKYRMNTFFSEPQYEWLKRIAER